MNGNKNPIDNFIRLMKYNFLVCLSFILISCYNSYKLTANGYYIHKKEKFRLNAETFTLPDSSVLSTNSIYECQCKTPEWFKFFPDGHLFVGYGDMIIKKPNDTIPGLTGFYKLDGNRITMEILTTENDWYISILEGIIENDELSLIKKYERNTNAKLKPTLFIGSYKKKSINPILPKPDW